MAFVLSSAGGNPHLTLLHRGNKRGGFRTFTSATLGSGPETNMTGVDHCGYVWITNRNWKHQVMVMQWTCELST